MRIHFGVMVVVWSLFASVGSAVAELPPASSLVDDDSRRELELETPYLRIPTIVKDSLAGYPMASDTRSEVAPTNRFDEFGAMAAADGSVRVIVTLQMLWSPVPLLSNAAGVGQTASIGELQGALLSDLVGTDHQVVHQYRFIPSLALELGEDAVRALEATGRVARIELDVAVPATLEDSVPLINADSAWGAGLEGTGQVVAVLDTGVDATHAFLAGKIVEEACYSLGSDCPNGLTAQTGTGAGVNCAYSGDCDHGTHVAGIAAGLAPPGSSGVARDADIMAVQVFSRFDSAASCSPRPAPCAKSYVSDQMAGLERVFERRALYDIASVNMSLGGGRYFSTCDTDSRKAAIDNLLAAGIPTVISSGNDGWTDSVGAPGCISSAVTVASSTKFDARSSFSNSAPFVDLIAPGSSISSSVPGGTFESWNGTSMAAPHVAGAWAIVKEAFPGASVADVLQAFKDTGISIEVRSSPQQFLPRIDVTAALSELIIVVPPNDDFADAEPAAIPVALAATNEGATTEASEPLACVDPDVGTSPYGATLWYALTPAANMGVAIDTGGSSFDTVLGVYTGADLSSLTQIACDDDTPGRGTAAYTTFAATSGATYWVQVGGYGDPAATGDLALSIMEIELDVEAPVWPEGSALSAISVSHNNIVLSWNPATDNTGVTEYNVYVGGAFWGSTSTDTSMDVTGLLADTSYVFEVEAVDASGNESTDGPSLVEKTIREGSLPPWWPEGSTLNASDVFEDRATVVWSPAEDDVAVTDYAVYLDHFLFDTTTQTSYTVAGLTPGRQYHISIEAGDADDNWTSGEGPSRLITTAQDFTDTDVSIFEQDVAWLAGAGITRGCNPPVNDLFCPNDYVTRGQMAAFMVRALGLKDPGPGDLFVDDDDSVFEGDIDRLATGGITRGCSPPLNDRFCPNDYVTRGQMAAFLVRAFGYTDNGGGNLFTDDDGSIFENDVDRLGTAGVTSGCNPPTNDRFCPNGIVTRGQMAAFLRRALTG